MKRLHRQPHAGEVEDETIAPTTARGEVEDETIAPILLALCSDKTRTREARK
jgi:hypothetical protein